MANEIVQNIYSKYPRLEQLGDIEIIFSPEKYNGEDQLEFYHKGEDLGPDPSKTVIEIFNPDLKGEWLERAIVGDMLHGLPGKDSEFTDLRNEFKDSLNDQQQQQAKKMWQAQEARENHPPRSFEKAFDVSILDAFIRGYVMPDENNEWKDFYTDDQKQILEEMKGLLEQPKVQMKYKGGIADINYLTRRL